MRSLLQLARSGCVFVAVFLAAGNALANDALDIVVYGATGEVGAHVVDEALNRGHRVTAVSRNPSSIEKEHNNLTVVKGDLLDNSSVAEIVAGKDVVILSVRGVIGDSGTPESALQFIAAENLVDVLFRMEDATGSEKALVKSKKFENV